MLWQCHVSASPMEPILAATVFFLFFCGGQPWFLRTEVLLSQSFACTLGNVQGGNDLGAFVFVCGDQHLAPNLQKKHGFNTKRTFVQVLLDCSGGLGANMITLSLLIHIFCCGGGVHSCVFFLRCCHVAPVVFARWLSCSEKFRIFPVHCWMSSLGLFCQVGLSLLGFGAAQTQYRRLSLRQNQFGVSITP